jgi:putative endonuclease
LVCGVPVTFADAGSRIDSYKGNSPVSSAGFSFTRYHIKPTSISNVCEPMKIWSIYLLRDEYNSLYTGITTDVDRRFREHMEGGPRSAKFTRFKKQLELVYSCKIGDRSLVSKVEYRLKRLKKTEKEAIVQRGESARDLLERLELKRSR